MKYIQTLERAKSSSDQTIEEQAKQIKSLKVIVKKLKTRLKNQQHEQTMQHKANLRRIK